MEKELDLIKRRRSSNVRNNATCELDKMKGALIEKIIETGRLRRNCPGCYHQLNSSQKAMNVLSISDYDEDGSLPGYRLLNNHLFF